MRGRSMTDPDLVKFVEAQDAVYDRVMLELQSGHKMSHWMWFVFPQMAGLGSSPTAQRYAIEDLGQAKRYLADPLLGGRLREGVNLMLHHRRFSAREILGSPDDLKFRSCLTLFREAAETPDDRALFQSGLDAFYGGAADQRTLDLI